MSGARRFAIVSPNFYPRVCGVGDHSLRLGQELLRRGHEAAIFSRLPVEPHPEAPDLHVQGIEGRLPAVVAQGLTRAIDSYRPTELFLQFTSQMLDVWRFGSPAVPWIVEHARRSGIRVTLIAHELFVPWLPRPDLLLAALLQRAQFALLLKRCDRVFVTTDTRATFVEPLCRFLGVDVPGVIRVGPNALPVERSQRPPEPRARPFPQIGLFSTAAVGKRFDVVLDAFAEIAAAVPTAELVLIGDLGPPERPRVRAILEAISRHPARARIRVTGRLSLAQIAEEMSRLDLYLFPMETGANTRSGTLPVALGSGLPTVAVRGPDTDLALFRGDENIVFAPELTASAFADAALRLLADPVALARVGEGGRRLYTEHISWARIADRLLADR
jgi:glycosyltransferase involved in cell wall biosynthesis